MHQLQLFLPNPNHDLGFDSNTTVLLITAPPYVASFVSVNLISYHADRIQIRSLPAALSMVVAVAAIIVVVVLKETNQ